MFEHSIPALEFVITPFRPETAWHYISYMTADKTIKDCRYSQAIQ